jgi:hypothetical protein
MRSSSLIFFSVACAITTTVACSAAPPAVTAHGPSVAFAHEAHAEGGTCVLAAQPRPPIPHEDDGGLPPVDPFDGVTCTADPANGTCRCSAPCGSHELALNCSTSMDTCECTVDGQGLAETDSQGACPVEATPVPTPTQKGIWVYPCGFPH